MRFLCLYCLLLAQVGCRLPGIRDPVPTALANSRQLSQQAVAALERGQSQEAETLLAKAVAICPADHDARRYYAETLWLRDARPQAVAQVEEACRLDPEDTGLRVRLAEMYLALPRVELARQSVEMAIDRNPRLEVAWAVRGRVMRAQGDLRQALADYHRALGFSPGDRQVLGEVADVYRQLRQPERALETIQCLAETYSPGEEPVEVLCRLGQAYAALGRYDDAVASFSTAASRGTPSPQVLCCLGEAQWRAGRGRDAVDTLRQAIAIDPRYGPSGDLLRQIELAAQATPPVRR
jgi:tetratricopeptide (TPR) repeat protein